MADVIGVAIAGIFGIGFVFGMWVVLFRRELAPIERSRAVYGHAYEEILPRSRLKKARRAKIENESENIENDETNIPINNAVMLLLAMLLMAFGIKRKT